MRQTTIVNREKANKKWFVVDAEKPSSWSFSCFCGFCS